MSLDLTWSPNDLMNRGTEVQACKARPGQGNKQKLTQNSARHLNHSLEPFNMLLAELVLAEQHQEAPARDGSQLMVSDCKCGRWSGHLES